MFSAKKASSPLRSMSSADSARGLCPLDSHSSPERHPTRTAAGRCPAPAPMRRALLAGEAAYAARSSPEGPPNAARAPRRRGVLRGQRQGAALHPRLCGGHSSPEGPPTRRAPEGAALWTPAGVIDPRPRDADASPPRLRAGRGIFYAHKLFHILLNGPPERLRAVRLFALQIFKSYFDVNDNPYFAEKMCGRLFRDGRTFFDY